MSVSELFNAKKNAIIYTDEQKQALLKVHKFLESSDSFFLLAGYSGCGKTTIAENIANYKHATLLAPTNAAVNRLREKIDNDHLEYQTIHKCLFNATDDKKGTSFVKQKSLKANSTYIIDECSMIDKYILEVIIKDALIKKCKIIFMGDSFQLEPVGTNPWIFNWEKQYPDQFLPHNKYELTKVMRYDGSLLDIATQIRTNKISSFKQPENSDLSVVPKFNKSLLKDVSEGNNYVVLTSTNSRRVQYNQKIKQILDKTRKPKDLLGVSNNEVLVSISNSGGYSNGEIYIAVKPKLIHEFDLLITNKKGIQNKYQCYVYNINKTLHLVTPNLIEPSLHSTQIIESINFLDNLPIEIKKLIVKVYGKYGKKKSYISPEVTISTLGYAISCHKAQGQEWENVYIDANWMMPIWDNAKWFYTAITRAKNKVEIINNQYLKIK